MKRAVITAVLLVICTMSLIFFSSCGKKTVSYSFEMNSPTTASVKYTTVPNTTAAPSVAEESSEAVS